MFDVDMRLALPNHALIVGPSQSGKTTLCLNLLTQPDIFSPKPARILFFYDQYQPSYQEAKDALADMGVELLLYRGFTVPDLDDLFPAEDGGQTILLVDDFSEESSASQNIARIATNGRHKNLSIWLIWHQLFSRHPASRTISQNVRYCFFLPSIRLESQIATLGSQLNMRSALVAAFKACANVPHGYLMLDLGPGVLPMLRMRTCIDGKDRQVCFF